MSDRKEFQAARDAGLAIRQQRRIETREELRRRTRREVAEEIVEALKRRRDEARADEQRGWPLLSEAMVIAREIGDKEAS